MHNRKLYYVPHVGKATFRPSLLSNGYQGPSPWGVNLPGREGDQSRPSSAEVKERVDLYLHCPNTSSWRGA
jgi:hypothetical protein